MLHDSFRKSDELLDMLKNQLPLRCFGKIRSNFLFKFFVDTQVVHDPLTKHH